MASGPSRSTRGQLKERTGSSTNKEKKGKEPHEPISATVGRLANQNEKIQQLFSGAVRRGNELFQASGRSDGGSDESIVSPVIAEEAVFNDVGRFKKVLPIKLKEALKMGDKAETFNCTRTWVSPRRILYLRTGLFALRNIFFSFLNMICLQKICS